MVIDYSKWDNLELSDDSDIEVHPNVDKKSFIRWKQRDIHEKRHVRAQEKDHLRNELDMNAKLLARIDKILEALKSHTPTEATSSGDSSAAAADELVLKTMFSTNSDVDKQRAQGAPDNAPTFGQMITKLADKVASEIPKDSENRLDGFVKGFQKHRDELAEADAKSRKKLEDMEREDARKITSDGLRTGFNSTHITKPDPQPAMVSPGQPKKKLTKTKVQQVEVLNPHAAHKHGSATANDSISSGAEADVEEGDDDGADEEDDDDDDMKVSELGRQFAKLKVGDYRAYAEFIAKHPSVLAESETDGLLIEAFNSQLENKDDYARQCVHQALLLQYCRQLGRDGVALFFKRITTPNHQAQKVFQDDVNSTYNRIRSRAKEISEQRAADAAAGTEQIQLHAVDPNTQITIGIPPADSDDPQIQESRKIFESFPPGLQRALESGSLDDVNTVLGKMAVEEAEEIVAKLSAGGMLSLEESIIDATTEEGKAKLAEIEKNGQENKGKGKAVPTTELE